MFNFKNFIKLFKNYKFNFLLKIKQEKKSKNKLIFIYNFFNIINKNIISNNIIKNINYGIIFFVIINIIIFIFLFFYLYSVDIMLYLYPDKIINYLNKSIDKEAAGLNFTGVFLPISQYFVSLKNLHIGSFWWFEKEVKNRVVILLQFYHDGAIRPLNISKRRSKYMKIFFTEQSVVDKSQNYLAYCFPPIEKKEVMLELHKPYKIWEMYIQYHRQCWRLKRWVPRYFKRVRSQALNSLAFRTGLETNGQYNEFLIENPYDFEIYDAEYRSAYAEAYSGKLELYPVKRKKIEYFKMRERTEGKTPYNYTTKSHYGIEDFMFFKGFYYRYKYKLQDQFMINTYSVLGDFYIYYLDLTSDKIFFNIYIFFDYIWSFFFNKIKSLFISFFFFIIWYFYNKIVPLFIFLYSFQLGNPFSFIFLQFLGYLKLIFSYISGTFVYYYFQKGTYYTIFHSSSFSLLILLLLKIVFFFFLLFMIMLILEDYFNEMEDTLRLPIEVLGLSFILIVYAFFVSFNYFMGPFAI